MIKIDLRRLWLRLTENVDSLLLSFILMLMLISLGVLYSASGQDLAKTSGQIVNMAVALLLMWMVAKVPPQHLARLALPVYAFGLLLLVGVALFGDVSHGARRWLHVGVTRIQASEMMKLAGPLMLAWYLDGR